MKAFSVLVMMQFKMLLRNRILLVGSLGLAIISMLIFGFLFSNDTYAPMRIGVVDLDKSATSAQIISALKANSGLTIVEGEQASLLNSLKNGGDPSSIIILPQGFGSDLLNHKAQVKFYVDESNLSVAAQNQGVINSIFDQVGKKITGYTDPVNLEEQHLVSHKQRQIDVLTPGMLGLTIMFANMYVGITLVNWRESGTLKRLSATPLKAWQLIASQVLSQFVLSFVQILILIGLAVAVFNVRITWSEFPALVILSVAGAFSTVSLGYAVGNFVRKGDAGNAIVTLISLPMMFLGGSYFRVSPPTFLVPVVEAIPLTHLNRALRTILLNDGTLMDVWQHLLILVAYGVVLLIFAMRTFRWTKAGE